ncbi:MAG: FkbM family methyltransferase [Pseudonocardiales bacterium]|nr:FkbM family methyltransferase [Pseudonocardiales bacterium]
MMRSRLRGIEQRMMRAVVRRLPEPVADRLRTSLLAPPTTPLGRLRHALLTALRHGGIPLTVRAFQLADNPARSFATADSLVLAQLYWFGEQGWEPELLPWWRYFCRRSSAILELGANVGYYVVQGMRAAPGVRYTAVEPHPTSLSLCRTNLGLNGITSVTLVAGAAVAGPAPGTARLLIPHGQLPAPTVAFLDSDSELPARMAGPVEAAIEVPTVDVRTLLDGVDLLKIDVEGQEHALLAAADDHLRAHRPTVVIEVLPGTARLRWLLAQLCGDLGYRCYVPQPDRLLRLTPDRLGEVALLDEYGIQDLILCADPGLPLTVAELDLAGYQEAGR